MKNGPVILLIGIFVLTLGTAGLSFSGETAKEKSIFEEREDVFFADEFFFDEDLFFVPRFPVFAPEFFAPRFFAPRFFAPAFPFVAPRFFGPFDD